MKMILVLAATALVACGNSKPPASPVETTKTEPVADATPRPVSTNVAVSGDILAQCKIDFSNSAHAPKFDYDQSSLQPDDQQVLEQVSMCLTSGPLKGRSVQLIGRADPRGTTEYNMALGEHRAHEVDDFLHSHGVASRIRETSRGALDAKGHDEDSWRTDRRVDLILGS
jgi:peptidoglycan-associated lipoprotein